MTKLQKTEWFNCSQVDYTKQHGTACRYNLGKRFKVTMRTGTSYIGVYCQISKNDYRFISVDSGNRITDDNYDIVKAVPHNKVITKDTGNDDVDKAKSSFEAMLTDINMVVRLNIAIDMATPQVLEGNPAAIEDVKRMKSDIIDHTECAYSHFLRLMRANSCKC